MQKAKNHCVPLSQSRITVPCHKAPLIAFSLLPRSRISERVKQAVGPISRSLALSAFSLFSTMKVNPVQLDRDFLFSSSFDARTANGVDVIAVSSTWSKCLISCRGSSVPLRSTWKRKIFVREQWHSWGARTFIDSQDVPIIVFRYGRYLKHRIIQKKSSKSLW